MKYKNTLQKGSVSFIVFKEGDAWYGVCLDFNIVESGDTPQEAGLLLSEAIEGYLESARKIKARPYILNQKPDPEYEEMWDKIEGKKILLKEVFSFGSFNIGNRAFASVQKFMPHGVYNWTAEDVMRFLRAHGFVLNHTRGSHYYYVGRCAGSFRQVCVPFHGSRVIKPRTMSGIIRQSGIIKKVWLADDK